MAFKNQLLKKTIFISLLSIALLSPLTNNIKQNFIISPKIVLAAGNINCTEDKLKNDVVLGRKICTTFQTNGMLCVRSGWVCSLNEGKKINCNNDDYNNKVLPAILATLGYYENDCAVAESNSDTETGGLAHPCTGYDYAIQHIYEYCYNQDFYQPEGIPTKEDIINQQDKIGNLVTDIFLSGSGEVPTDEDNCLIAFLHPNWKDIFKMMFPIAEVPIAIIRIFAAIALGMRAITGYVADAFVWSFTGLPQKVGGYVHFMPIYDSSTKTGIWYTLLNFSYLGIVLGMIFSSIATFFGIEKYSYRKMFPRLIILALLINFSLVFIGIVVDLSNYLTFIFFPGGDGQGLAHLLVTVINNIICAIRGVDQSFAYTAGATVGLIITSIMLFQFVGLIYFVIIRYLTILLCAATSPLAALGIALNIPKIEGIVNLWRNKLTEALVNIVILSIAFYFSLTITSNIANNIVNTTPNTSQDTKSLIILIVYSIFIIALFQLVRIAGKAVGVSQIEAGFNWAKGLAKTATFAAITAAGGFALDKFMTSGAWSKAQKALLENGAKGNLIAGNLGRWMSKTQNSFTAQRYKGVSDTLMNESPDVIRTRLAQYEKLGDKERATIALGVLAQKGELTQKDLPLLAKYSNYSNFNKNVKSKLDKYPDIKLALNAPYFAQEPDVAYSWAMGKLTSKIITTSGKIDNLANWEMVFNSFNKDKAILNSFTINLADSLKKFNPPQITGILNKIASVLSSTSLSDQEKRQIASEIIKILQAEVPVGRNDSSDVINAINESLLKKFFS
jgi:hypothetical protein